MFPFRDTPTSSRRLRRFFLSTPLPDSEAFVDLGGKECRHLSRVLRLRLGDRCLVTDGTGREAEASIVSLTENKVQLKVEKILKGTGEYGKSRLYLCVYMALPQKGKMDDLVEKAQELGVQELQPVKTERTVVQMTPEAQTQALRRWHRIAVASAKQSGSLSLVKIEPPVLFKKAVREAREDHRKIIFHPSNDAMSFGEWVKGVGAGLSPLTRRRPNGGKPAPRYALFFGPEGGFTEKEVELACSKGAEKVRLGENILKMDTAFLSVVSSLRLLFL